MQVHPAVRGTLTIVFSFLWFASLVSFGRAQEELPPEIDADGVQTLTRGPVHEAFASPTVADPKPNLVIPKRPPEDVREQPPEYQPEGQNVQWFPGYWSWDEDREDFIWVSGAWRDPPPGKRWVPGYWAEVSGGFQWVAGFWIDEAVEEMEYLKPPPESLEQGPSVTSPGDNYQYIPGTWTYINNDYRWQAGYWSPYQEDWVYVPAQWIWTPRGCVFVPGYYDWRVPRRGQIFAPVYFSNVVYTQPTYFYRPRCIINTSNLFVHLWVRPSYCHYYFGNYYGSIYANRHFTPWCDYRPRPRCYDPLLSYCNVHYRRQGIDYVGRMKGWHNHYDRHEHERPPITYRDQIAHLRDHDRDDLPGRHTRPTPIAEDLKDVIRRPDHKSNWKFMDVAAKDRTKSGIEDVKKLHNLRLDQEKVAFIDKPGRRPGGDLDGKPLSDRPDLKLPGVTLPDDRLTGDKRPGRPNLTGDGTKTGSKPATGDIVGIPTGDSLKPGKVKLPKPALASTNPGGKPVIKAPATPDRNIINRGEVNRPTVNRPNVTLPGSGGTGIGGPGSEVKLPDVGKASRIPGLRNPSVPNTAGNTDHPGRSNKLPEVGSKLPDLTGPENAVGPRVEPRDPRIGERNNTSDKKFFEPNSGIGNDAKKPNVGNSAAAAAQQRLEALRAQQQDLINKARNQGNNTGGSNLGGNNLGGSRPNVRGETPRVEVPKVERPKVNVGGGNELRNPGIPRNTVPNNTPRNLGPSVEPRSFKPNTSGNSGNIGVPRSVQRPSTPNVVPRINTAPRIDSSRMNSAPRINTTPRVEPRGNPAPRVELRSNPGNSGNAGGNSNDKRRGR